MAPQRSYGGSRGGGRVAPAPRGYTSPGYAYRGYNSRGYTRVAPRIISPRYGYAYRAPYRFSRPYYSFRPYFNLGFGLWAGYPVVYPYYAYPYAYDPYYYDYYGYDYPYDYPYDYGTPYPAAPGYAPGYNQGYAPGYAPGYSTAPNGSAPGTLQAQPGTANLGGLSFDITPNNAQVYVDGNPMGAVSEFTPTSAPLSLAPGRHHVEIRAPGYETMSFDVDVVAGQVIPYQGTMQPQR